MLDQRAEGVAVGSHQDRLAGSQLRRDVALPEGQHAIQGDLEALGSDDAGVRQGGVLRVVAWVMGRVQRALGGRNVIRTTP